MIRPTVAPSRSRSPVNRRVGRRRQRRTPSPLHHADRELRQDRCRDRRNEEHGRSLDCRRLTLSTANAFSSIGRNDDQTNHAAR
jgi:hypothetical protein